MSSWSLKPSAGTSTFSALTDLVTHHEGIDDRKLLLEHGLSYVSRHEGPLSQELQEQMVKLLYNDLPHPPATAVGPEYAYRTATGADNNMTAPEVGKAGTTYARSVQQSGPLPVNELPDPGLIFDTLLKREKFVEHPAGLSSLMFAFAALVIHTVFRTSHTNANVNETSSYVDLSPLYGHDDASQNQVRKREGRGELYPDVFAENRLQFLPPAVCALLILFARNHNYIAAKLLEINERNTFSDPATLSGKELDKQDEELFQTARLVNIGWFASIVFSDYFSCILGLVREGSSWSLNPFGEMRNMDHSLYERGRGNACSVEFNCLYRWHATTSQADEQWTELVFKKLFPGKDIDDVTPEDFKLKARELQASETDLPHWTFGVLQRKSDGYFADDEIANLIHDATDRPAGAFKARGTPACMRLHEVMGIEQNRKWGVCSLNDFRKFLGLKEYSSFREWNPDPAIADAAEKLYGDINRLELYVGLQAEEAKPVVDGAGLCPGYTISRAILSDAIALTRGDRFFTHDYTPHNLTAWGFADCQRDPAAYGFGSTLGRLLLRTLPNNFTRDSVYTFFPLMTPQAMKVNLKKLNLHTEYDFIRPGTRTAPVEVADYKRVNAILKNKQFTAPYAERASEVVKGPGFYPVATAEEHTPVVQALAANPEAEAEIAKTFYNMTKQLIEEQSFSLVGGKTKGVDVVRDVLKVVPVYWAAKEIAGIQLKTETTEGEYTIHELYDMLSDIYSFIFLHTEPAKYMVLQAKVSKDIEKLLNNIRAQLGGMFSPAKILAFFYHTEASAKHGEIVRNLRSLGHSNEHIANEILAIMVGSTAELSLGFTNMINMYLGSENEADLKKSSTTATPGNFKNLVGYALESLRLDPPIRGVHRMSLKDQSLLGGAFKQNSHVFLDIVKVCRDGEIFPKPEEVDPSRPLNETLATCSNCSRSIGAALMTKIMAQVLAAVFSLPNVQRAPGQSGILKRYKDKSQADLVYAYLDGGKLPSPWPTSMCITYDA